MSICPATRSCIAGAAAAIGHELEARAGRFLEEDAGDMRRAAGAGGALRRRVGVGLQPGDQILQVFRGQRPSSDDEQRWVAISGPARNRSAGRTAMHRWRRSRHAWAKLPSMSV